MYSKLLIASAYLAAIAAALPGNAVSAILRRTAGQVVQGGAATTSVNDQDGGGASDAYTYFQGDGSGGAGWPDRSAWSSYEALWAANLPLLQQSCGWNSWGADNSADEIAALNSAIEAVAAQTAVDHRFILAIVMQESKGCVRVPTTNNGVRNPGLMQDHDGAGSCAGVDPCPADQITQMIVDGTGGTAAGDGLAGVLNTVQGAISDSSSRAFYAAARLYNSGSADYSDLGNGLGSTHCYASDVANRLLGWALATSTCA